MAWWQGWDQNQDDCVVWRQLGIKSRRIVWRGGSRVIRTRKIVWCGTSMESEPGGLCDVVEAGVQNQD